MAKQYDKEFKQDAVNYRFNHLELTVKQCAENLGALNILGVSVSGYKAWKHRKPSQSELRRNRIKENIIDIYNDSYQNYGAPKITQELRKIQ